MVWMTFHRESIFLPTTTVKQLDCVISSAKVSIETLNMGGCDIAAETTRFITFSRSAMTSHNGQTMSKVLNFGYWS